MIKRLIALTFAFGFMQSATAITTGMTFAGGCVEDAVTSPVAYCDEGNNADVQNVAVILGVDESLVTEIYSGYSVTGIGDQMGSWSITDTSITHLAFKSNGYYILGEITAPATSGMWDNDPSNLGEWDLTNVQCPAEICGVVRDYTLADFETNGGNIADLSNVAAFSVVPVPAAVWLFMSALGGLGFLRRRA